MNKTAILPIVTVLAGAYTLITKDAVKPETIDTIVNIATIVVGSGISIWGIWKNHKKEVK
jgi:hypothetical protein